VSTHTEHPGSALGTAEQIDLVERSSAHNYHPLPVVVAEAEGVWVTDVEGKRYLDMLSAYSALNFGHRHPALVQAAKRQLDRLTLTSRAFHNDRFGPWAAQLAELAGMEMVLPMNTGAEGVETAIKTARKWGYERKSVPEGRAKVVVCEHNFHVEPIQGEAGVIVPPEGYLRRARALCTERNVLLIADEIQSGLGRTGTTFACEHEGVVPDMYVLGKALGGGIMPLSAVVASREILGVFTPGTHGSTFGGNPLACAIGLEVLAILRTGELQERSAKLGEHMLRTLREADLSAVREVRGRGLWAGIQLTPGAMPARTRCEELMQHGVLAKDTHEATIRLAPPLVISEQDLDWALERVKQVLAGAPR
jgi:ornithine--oxo-acid transaminase